MDLIAALRAFVRVTETGSFSAVARETNASQSAVTRQIASVGTALRGAPVPRTTRRLSLTDDGQALLGHARHLIESAEEMEACWGGRAGAAAGWCASATSVAGGLFLATRLPVLLARHPGLSDRTGGPRPVQRHDRGTAGPGLAVRRHRRRLAGGAAGGTSGPRRGGRADLPRAPRCAIDAGGPGDARMPDARRRARADVWPFTGPEGPITVRVSGGFIANNSQA